MSNLAWLAGKLSRRFRRHRPAFDLPTGLVKQIGGSLAKITAAGDQDARHRDCRSYAAAGAISISSKSLG